MHHAQAYLGIAKPTMKDHQEKLSYAEKLLFAIEDSGLSDAKWCHAMGKALYLQDREAEGLPYLERAVDLAPEDSEIRRLSEASFREIENRTRVKEMSIRRVANFYDSQDWVYKLDLENATLSASFDNSIHIYTYNGTSLLCEYLWKPNAPG